MTLLKPRKMHEKQIAKLQKKIRRRKKPLSLSTSSQPSNTLRNSGFKKKIQTVDISDFNQILSIDKVNGIVEVEPKITIRALTTQLLNVGLMLPVVPEFGSITVGGAILGTSLESSSHRFGQFNDICLEYTCLLGDGSEQKASPSENSDLFYALAGSYGTLAILTSVKIQLIKASKYVKLRYRRFWDHPHVIDHLQHAQKKSFCEGVIFSKKWAVAIEGTLCDSHQNENIYQQNSFWHPWFYQHVAKVTRKGDYEEIMPLKDYLFRFDQGAFWMGRMVMRTRLMIQLLLKINLPEIGKKLKKENLKRKAFQGPSFLFRLFFGSALSSQKLYKIWHRVPSQVSENLFFIQDFYTPYSQTKKILDKCIHLTGIYPIWLCPIKNTTSPQFLSPHMGTEPLLNVGLYGIPKTRVSIPLLTERLEKELYKHDGKKMLYSFTYLDKDLFSKKYDEATYQLLRKKYRAHKVFPKLYNKVTEKS